MYLMYIPQWMQIVLAAQDLSGFCDWDNCMDPRLKSVQSDVSSLSEAAR